MNHGDLSALQVLSQLTPSAISALTQLASSGFSGLNSLAGLLKKDGFKNFFYKYYFRTSIRKFWFKFFIIRH
jgi:hypothetical protein